MILAKCPHCSWNDEVDDQFMGIDVECPECDGVFYIPKKKKTKKKSFSMNKKPVSRQAKSGSRAAQGTRKGSRNQQDRRRSAYSKQKPVSIFAAQSLMIFHIFACLSMFVGLGILFLTADVQGDVKQKEVAPIFGIVFILMGIVGAAIFALIPIGLAKRSKLAYRFASGLSMCYVLSPFIIWGLFAISSLSKEEVQEEFGVD